VCAALVFLSLSLSAQGSRMVFPSLDAAPVSHQYAQRLARNGAAYWQDLAEAALWASSVNAGPGSEEKAAAYMGRINSAAAELSTAADLPANPKERGEYVLVFLHKRFLKSYSEYQTRVDEIFISGRYNCVSSAVLYMVLGLSAGLDVSGVMTKDHAFITVNTGAERIDVETTNLYGFDPGNRKEFHDAFGKATGFAYVPAKNYRDRVEISGIELVSLILSNRIAVLEKGNRYSEAVPLAINRAALLSAEKSSGSQDKADFFEDPRGDTMNRIFNLGAYLIKTGREDDALAWAEYAGGRFPDPQHWQDLINTAVNNKLVKLIRAKKTANARAELNALKPRLSADNYNTLDTMVLEVEAADMVNGIRNPGDVEAALAFLSRSWEKLPEQIREEMRTTAILKEAERIGRSRDWTGGMAWLNAAMEQYGKNSRFESAFRTFRQNRVGQFHNEFAALFNKGNYTGAKASVEKALVEFPEERQLLQDLNLVNKALQQ
jgi:tetratricopeptide (TPR) repeat protein